MKVAITGAEGFIGREISKEFQKLHEVEKFDFKNPSKNPLTLCKELNEKKQYDVVLHFGANSDAQVRDFSQNYYENVGYSLGLVSVCAVTNTPLVFASSAAVYGNSYGHELSPYAKSKQIVEEFIIATSGKFKNWKNISLRLSNIYGVGEVEKGKMMSIPMRFMRDAKVLQKIEIWNITRDEKPVVSSRDFLYVGDLVRLVQEIAETPTWKNEIMDVGSGVSTSLIEVAGIVSKLVPSEIEIVAAPSSVDLNHYQEFTRADLTTLEKYIPNFQFTSIEAGIHKLSEGGLDA